MNYTERKKSDVSGKDNMNADVEGFHLQQATIAKSIVFSGTGLHNAGNTTVTLTPAPENHGIVFRRDGNDNTRVSAHWKYWINTQLLLDIAK